MAPVVTTLLKELVLDFQPNQCLSFAEIAAGGRLVYRPLNGDHRTSMCQRLIGHIPMLATEQGTARIASKSVEYFVTQHTVT